MVRFGRDERAQLLEDPVDGSEDGCVVEGADCEHQSFAIEVERPQVEPRRGDMFGDDDLGEITLPTPAMPAQIIGRVLRASWGNPHMVGKSSGLHRRQTGAARGRT